MKHRICPHVLQFDSSNNTHVDFIVAASNLMAYIYAIPQVTDRHQIIRQVNRIQVSKFEYKPNSINEEDIHLDTHTSTHANKSKIDKILARLPKSDEYGDIKIQPHHLKIDDDSNFQLDYMVIMTNLRSENYDIESVDRSEVKRIAGAITPAIVTTATMVAGLMSLEMYKLVQRHQNIEYFRDSFVNLGLPFFIFTEPMPVKRQRV